ARDHEELSRALAEAEDRYGSLPPPVRSLFAVGSLRLTAMEYGIEEISTFRSQVRIKPVAESVGLELAEILPEASFHPATRTLNLQPPTNMGGEALTQWVESALRRSDAERPAPAGPLPIISPS